MDEQKKMFTNKSVTLFLVIVISVSAIFETIVIALRAMGLAVFLMWVPTIAAIIAGCISQKENIIQKITSEYWISEDIN